MHPLTVFCTPAPSELALTLGPWLVEVTRSTSCLINYGRGLCAPNNGSLSSIIQLKHQNVWKILSITRANKLNSHIYSNRLYKWHMKGCSSDLQSVGEDDVGVHGPHIQVIDDGVLQAVGTVPQHGQLLHNVLTNLQGTKTHSAFNHWGSSQIPHIPTFVPKILNWQSHWSLK